MVSDNATPAWKVPASIAWRKVEDQAIVLDLESSHYYSLDPIGTRIWELLCEGRAAHEIAADLALEYDAPAEKIKRDVSELVRELSRSKLLASEEL
ncbi:MAG: PqqD family protein [Elusimicrobia bacterium]|nr:PqqD family protein [Elusimicrobiota bacterium]